MQYNFTSLTKYLSGFFFICCHVVVFGQVQNIDITLEDRAIREGIHFENGMNKIHLCGLIPGEKYGFQFLGEITDKCLDMVTIHNGTFSQMGIGNPMSFIATTSCVILDVEIDCAKPVKSAFSWMSVFCISCKRPVDEGLRYSVAPISDPDYLIREVFIGGGCFDVSGVTAIGNTAGLGEFSDGGPLGIESGVIMASGNVGNSQGPNNNCCAGNSLGQGGDPDLNLLSGQTTYDATGIEFDFSPTIPQVTFNYVFASEEYPEYVCASFNDVFGFFVNGPGITGGFSNGSENIAWIPGTSIPVGINTVNPGVPGQFGGPNCGPKGSLSYSQYYVDNTGGQELQYDGWTTVFQAVANVQVCESYHIKLVVADAGDSIFDSAVFLEANSFNAGGKAEMTFEAPTTGTDLVYEACNDGVITICKSNPIDLNNDVTLNFNVHPSSTATPGLDYTPFGTSFFIPAGEDCVQFQLEVLFDLITEGIEVINLELELPCSCVSPFVQIRIADTPPISAELDDVTICEQEGVDLSVLVTGGVPGFYYNWETGSTDPSIFINPTQTKTWKVTVTDECGQEAEAISNVTVIPIPRLTLAGDGLLCIYDSTATVDVTVTFEPANSGPWSFSYMLDGEIYYVNNVTQNPYIFKVNKPGFLLPLDVSNSRCTGIVDGFGLIEENKVEVFYDITPVSCQGIEDGKIQAIAIGIHTPYEFFWSGGYGYTDLLDPIGVGKYYVTITDALGCARRDSVILTTPSDITVMGNVTGDTECFSPTGSVVLFVNGGLGPYTYNWSNGSTAQNPNNLPGGINRVTVTDSRGCEAYAQFNIIASDAPIGVATPAAPATCGNPNGGAATLTVTGGTPGYTYLWSNNGGTNQNPTNLQGGTYEVTITDSAGCTNVAMVDVPYDTITPVSNAGAPDTMTCGVNSLLLDGSGSSTGAQYTYQWTTVSGTIISGATSLTPTIGSPGGYTLIVTDVNNGCTASSIVQIAPDLNAPQIALALPDTIKCNQPTIVLNGSGSSSGPQYVPSWSTPNGTIISGGNTLNPTVGGSGIYILTLTNTDNNCVSVMDVTVVSNTQPPAVAIAPPLQVTCKDPTIVLNGSGSASGPGITYAWTTSNGNITTGGTTNSATVNAAGNYTLLVTNTWTGCTAVQSVNVVEDKVPPIATTGVTSNITCITSEVELLGQGSSTGGNITYLWTTFSGNITGSTTAMNSTANAAGGYLLTVTNLTNGCNSFSSVIVDIDTVPPVAFAGPPQNLNCSNPQTSLDGTNSTNVPFTSFQWTTPDGNIVNGAQTLTPLVNAGGTYFLVVTDEINGCTAQSFTVVTGDFKIPVVIIEPPAKLTCTNNTVLLDASASDFNSLTTFNWTTIGGNILQGGNTVTPTINAPGIYSLSSLNTQNGCQGFGSVTVTEDKVIPIADAGKPGEIYCLGDSVKLDGSLSSTGTAYTHDWYLQLGGPAYFLNQQTPYTQEANTYFLVVTDTRNGCTSVDQVTIGADYLTSADVQMSDPICFDDPGTLEIFNVVGGLYPYQYSINGGQSYQYNPKFRNLASGLYNIVVKDAKGCEIKDAYEIPEVNELLVHIEPEIIINLGEKVKVEAQLNIDEGKLKSITWYPAYGLDRTDSTTVFANPYITTPYFVTVIDTFGCEGKTQFKIVVRDPKIFVPSAFSPYNKDGNNDKLMVYAGDLGIEQIDIFEIYTRWGERVFSAINFQPNDETYGWDGFLDGERMNPAVFVYYAKVRLIDGRVLTVKGDFTLME